MHPQNPAKGPDDPERQEGLFGVGAAGAQSFLHQLLDNTPTVISVTSLEDRFLFVNYAWEQLTGAPIHRAVGRHMLEVFRPATARRFIEANRRVVASGAPLQLEETIESPDGVRYYHSVKIPVRDAYSPLEKSRKKKYKYKYISLNYLNSIFGYLKLHNNSLLKLFDDRQEGY